jgi:putative IMPACT (imprinted ancient) family translation regulator
MELNLFDGQPYLKNVFHIEHLMGMIEQDIQWEEEAMSHYEKQGDLEMFNQAWDSKIWLKSFKRHLQSVLEELQQLQL